MTVLYLDSFLFINLTLNYLLLLGTAKLLGERLLHGRFFLSALLGMVYAGGTVFPQGGFLLHPVYKAGVALIMLLIAFGRSRHILRVCLVFFGIASVFCGAILGIACLKGGAYLRDGAVYSALDIKGLLMSALFCYGVLSLFFRRAGLHHLPQGELLTVCLEVEGRSVRLLGLEDSGNTLQDPVTGQAVPVVEGESVLGLFPKGLRLRPSDLEAPVETLQALAKHPFGKRFRLLPYRAVGVRCGMLLAMRVDVLEVEGQCCLRPLIALSPTPVSDGGAYRVLMGHGKGERVGL